MNKQFGEGSSFRASKKTYRAIPRLSSGSFLLDYGLGGGWPRGRISLAWGPKSSGKTTSYIRACADAQKRDAITNAYLHLMNGDALTRAVPMSVGWCDAEGTFDQGWAMKQGMNLDSLELSVPESQEEAIDIVEMWVASGAYDVVVLDSIAAYSPLEELDKTTGQKVVGTAALLNNKMFRKLQSRMNSLRKSRPGIPVPTVLIVNQERHKIGVTFGSSKTKPGGVGQDFFTSVEVTFYATKLEYWDTETKMYPKQMEFGFKIEKNKISPPKIQGVYKQALSDHPHGQWEAGDIIEVKEVMDFAGKLGIYEEIGEGSKKKWKMYDKEYKRKKDVMDEWCTNEQNFMKLKEDLLKILFPKH